MQLCKQHTPEGTRLQSSEERVYSEELLSSAGRVRAVESKRAKPNVVYVHSIYQMPFQQAH